VILSGSKSVYNKTLKTYLSATSKFGVYSGFICLAFFKLIRYSFNQNLIFCIRVNGYQPPVQIGNHKLDRKKPAV